MIKFHLRIALGLVLLASLIGSAGCTESDPLNSTVGELLIDLQLVNDVTEFEVGSFSLRQVSMRPVNPDASNSLGPADVGMLRDALLVTFDEPGVIDARISASVGRYEVTAITVQQIRLTDFNPPVGQATCEDYVTSYLFNSAVGLTNFGAPLFINIVNDQPLALTITIDVAAFVEAFVDSWTCRQNCFPPFPPEPWCPQTFITSDFNDQATSFLSID
jgi:hypothetical protein